MKLITYATHDSGYFRALGMSSKNNGFELIVLGYNKKWEGFNQKFIEITDHLKTYENKDEIICFVDGFDCIVLGTSDEMLNKYKNTNSDKVLFAADVDSFLSTEIFDETNKKDSEHEYNHLNTGCYIGKTQNILDLLSNLCNFVECKNDASDQNLLTSYYNKCVDCLNIDFDRNIFYNLRLDLNSSYSHFLRVMNIYNTIKAPLQSKYYKFENNRIILDNGNLPIILHGNNDINMDLIVEKIGYPVSIKNNKNYYDYSIKPYIDILRNKYSFIFNFLYYSIASIHVMLYIGICVLVFLTNDVFLLSILVLTIYLITLQWFLVGNCIVSNIENLLKDSKKLDNGKEYSFLLEPFMYLFGENFSYYFTTLFPAVLVIIALIKINHSVSKS